jgi:hypothetical protein
MSRLLLAVMRGVRRCLADVVHWARMDPGQLSGKEREPTAEQERSCSSHE